MFALYFNDSQGARQFVVTLEEFDQAISMARMLSRQDVRDVVVIENRALGDTIIRAVFRHGGALESKTVSLEAMQLNSESGESVSRDT